MEQIVKEPIVYVQIRGARGRNHPFLDVLRDAYFYNAALPQKLNAKPVFLAQDARTIYVMVHVTPQNKHELERLLISRRDQTLLFDDNAESFERRIPALMAKEVEDARERLLKPIAGEPASMHL